ncbi:regulator of G-protein signaling loco [Musca vetustissima]|uniref:regulator of G-protein signaling loco n=1 Tax=Musca vetustissima TaxID=27455 RepID=UPI002AB67908|nr:regulator of G-protein signaling loco [Musca vetustissima]
MHHHHPHPPAVAAPGATTTTSKSSTNSNTPAVGATTTSLAIPLQQAASTTTSSTQPPPPQQQQPPTHRRRKKRPNYGTRTVEVRRGYNGFGFTISGQQPCRLSCIIANSPADQAGLRAGDFLISVNGLNVSKLPHETVVQLIGNSFGSIRMQIAEHYYSDSTDEENAVAAGVMPTMPHMGPSRPRYIYHKTKQQRLRHQLPQTKKYFDSSSVAVPSSSRTSNTTGQPLKKLPQPLMKSISMDAAAASKRFVNEKLVTSEELAPPAAAGGGSQSHLQHQQQQAAANFRALVMRGPTSAALEYRAIVGYLGTIEMPKQIANSSKLQTVRSCIRKLRQEKRQPTVVLMIILPDCLKLQANNGKILATYPSARLNYVSSSSESENRFFGLVTSAVYSPQLDDVDDDDEEEGDPEELQGERSRNHNGDNAADEQQNSRRPPAPPNLTTSSSVDSNVIISNSCHVFVVDTKLCEHQQHLAKAQEFCIECTKDPISNLCLEFPNNSEYVVNLIRSMYTMRIVPPITQRSISDDPTMHGGGAGRNDNIAHSPQPSNHSEVSTTTSNSDSGIGYNNDCSNVTDRIVLVDFSLHNAGARGGGGVRAPSGGGGAAAGNHNVIISPKRPQNICEQNINSDEIPSSSKHHIPNPHRMVATESKINYNSPGRSLMVSRSCDDVLNLIEQEPDADDGHNLDPLTSVVPFQQCYASMDDISLHTASMENEDKIVISRSTKPDNVNPLHITLTKADNEKNSRHSNEGRRKSLNLKIPNSNSLQNLTDISDTTTSPLNTTTSKLASTPDLSRTDFPDGLSTFERGWIQSSLRTPRADKHTIHLSAPNPEDDDSQDQLDLQKHYKSPSLSRSASMNNGERSSFKKKLSDSKSNVKKGPTSWGTSIEILLADPAGLKTFAEFLKLEYAAENIYFWTACERYRHIESETERRDQALEIFKKHLSSGSMEPVNVDSQARGLVERNLPLAGPDLFHPAQKQIFNLMKFDSYQRFLRSELYKQCLQAEKKGKSLPYSGDNLDDLLKTTNFSESASLKLKKSASNAEEGRPRRSLLPWHRKTRSKSRDQIAQDNNKESSNSKSQSSHGLKPNAIHGSASSLTSFDALTFNNNMAPNDLCRIKFPDGATTMVQLKTQETVAELVERLMEKRSIRYQFFDVTIKGPPSKSVDLKSLAKELANKEVEIEQRVAFKLDLPIPKVISVKSKPRKQLYEVVRPILQRYHINPELVEVLMRDSQTKVDLTQLVTSVNEQRLQVVYKKEMAYHRKAPTITKNSIAEGLQSTQTTLDAITNKVFSDLMQVKQSQEEAGGGAAMKPKFDQCSTKSEECPSESSSSFFKIRKHKRDSMNNNAVAVSGTASAAAGASRNNKTSKKLNILPSSQLVGENKIIPNKLIKTGIKLPLPLKGVDKQDDLLEDLKRAQLARLEDQRGTEINFELPEFLKNNDTTTNQLNKSNNSGENVNSNEEQKPETPIERPPQPAPRHSISNKSKTITTPTSPIKTGGDSAIDNKSEQLDNFNTPAKGPPPLPPKPKVLPIKPSNWGVNIAQLKQMSPTTPPPPLQPSPTPSIASPQLTNVNVVAVPATSSNSSPNGRCAYLDQPSSSFV